MLQNHMVEIATVIEPGDVTRYTVVYGVSDSYSPRWPMFFFAFGTGTDQGRWMQLSANDIPSLSFSYFAARLGFDFTKSEGHTAQVAFTIYLHLIGQERFVSDVWDRESELRWDALTTLPTLAQLMEDYRGKV